MGEEIDQTEFSSEETQEFHQRLLKETLRLKQMMSAGEFEEISVPRFGLELEAWLVDQDFIPSPLNKEFLERLEHPHVVPELAKFNFELNSDPRDLRANHLSQTQRALVDTWLTCQKVAEEMNHKVLAIGVLPTLRDQMLDLKYLSDMKRYRALNQQILNLRKSQPLKLHIQGVDELEVEHHDVMLESAATSLQVHLQVNLDRAKDYFNASIVASAASVAVSANSPFLFGKQLWEETRIPIFEQAIYIPSFRNPSGEPIGRVGFGTDYLKESPIELFIENLNAYDPLLPVLEDSSEEKLSHLRLHNGTIWRWNRPIIGFNSVGKPHFRIEHRVCSSGPSMLDVMVNIAFFLGLTQCLSSITDLVDRIPFEIAKQNFYQACRFGLDAQIVWIDGKKHSLQKLILDLLIPKASIALIELGVDSGEVEFYLKHCLHDRLMTGRNGACWQKSFVATHGKDFQALTDSYYEHQCGGRPIHEWNV